MNVALAVRNVGFVEIDPEADALGQVLPLFGVAKDRLHALFGKAVETVVQDRRFTFDAKLLFDLDLDGQAVGVPARATLHVVAAHRHVARKEILDDTGQDVTVVRQSVRRRRALVEDELRPRAALLEAAFKDAPLLPKLENIPLEGGKIRNGLVDLVESHTAANLVPTGRPA